MEIDREIVGPKPTVNISIIAKRYLFLQPIQLQGGIIISKRKYVILAFVILVVVVFLSIFMALKIQNKTIDHNGVELKTEVISIRNQSENLYEIPEFEINNGGLAFYKINGRDGINLKNGDEVLIILNIETESVDQCVLGYCINEQYIDFFSEPISDTLQASFTAQKGGDYYIYSIGVSASTTKITSGKIQIN